MIEWQWDGDTQKAATTQQRFLYLKPSFRVQASWSERIKFYGATQDTTCLQGKPFPGGSHGDHAILNVGSPHHYCSLALSSSTLPSPPQAPLFNPISIFKYPTPLPLLTLSTLWKIRALIQTKLGFANPVLSFPPGGRLPVDWDQCESPDHDTSLLQL